MVNIWLIYGSHSPKKLVEIKTNSPIKQGIPGSHGSHGYPHDKLETQKHGLGRTAAEKSPRLAIGLRLLLQHVNLMVGGWIMRAFERRQIHWSMSKGRKKHTVIFM